MMGDGINEVRANNVLNNYSIIYYNNSETYDQNCKRKVLFHCVSGIGVSESEIYISVLSYLPMMREMVL